jgi:hypothetical protein
MKFFTRRAVFISVFAVLFLLTPAFSALAQDGTVGVREIRLARDDGSGKAGEEAASFAAGDVPIYCIVQLDSVTPSVVKMKFVAVKVAGVKPETELFSAAYKTNGKQSRVNFTGSPEGGKWTAGNYRIDIFVDGKAAGSKDLEVQKSPDEKPAPKPAPKNIARRRLRGT